MENKVVEMKKSSRKRERDRERNMTCGNMDWSKPESHFELPGQ